MKLFGLLIFWYWYFMCHFVSFEVQMNSINDVWNGLHPHNIDPIKSNNKHPQLSQELSWTLCVCAIMWTQIPILNSLFDLYFKIESIVFCVLWAATQLTFSILGLYKTPVIWIERWYQWSKRKSTFTGKGVPKDSIFYFMAR